MAVVVWALLLGSAPCLAETKVANELEIEVGIGYDTNPFLAPGAPYFDQNRRDVVEPVRQPGFFVPFRIDGGLVVPLGRKGHRFVTDYRAKGNQFTDEAQSSADEVWIKLEPGFVLNLAPESRHDRTFEVRAFGSYNRELFFDRDTGLPATTSGRDVSDRYNYRAFGVELAFEYEITRAFEVYVEGWVENRNYDDPDLVEPFDHDRLGGELGTMLRLGSKVRWYLSYEHEARDYSRRFARGSDGDDAVGNPLLHYDLDGIATTLRYEPLRPWRLELDYALAHRSDTFINYNDYDEAAVRLRSTVEWARLWWRCTLKHRARDFDRAFIFNQPIDPSTGRLNPRRRFDLFDVELEAYVPVRHHLQLFGRLNYIDEGSNDPRFDYERSQAMVGVELAY